MALKPPPKTSDEHRREASRKAVAARRIRAAAKESVASGEMALADLVFSPSPVIGRMHVTEALMSAPGIGESTCSKALEECGISPRKRLAGLSEGQRDRLAAWIEGWEAAKSL